MIPIFIISCTQEKKSTVEGEQEKQSPIEGAWEIVYFKWTYPDSTFDEYPGNITMCDNTWILSGNNSVWYFKYKTNTDSTYIIEFGDVNYKHDGELYQETYLSSFDDMRIGRTLNFNIAIKNDTITLTGPGEGEEEILGCKVREVYVRK